MRIKHVYPRSFNAKRNARGTGFTKAFLLSGMLMVFMPFLSKAMAPDPAPFYGSFQNQVICANIPTDISQWLKVLDNDPAQTITWTLLSEIDGTMTGSGATSPSAGSGSVPGTAIMFTPDPGANNASLVVRAQDDNGDFVDITILFTVNAGPTLSLGAMPVICAGLTSASISFADLDNVGPDTAEFSYTGGMQSWTVPQFVNNVKFDIVGASGGHDNYITGGTPGKGGRVTGTLNVSSGTALNLFVGGAGEDGTPTGAAGGYNGGGNAYFYFYGSGGAGGGATDIRVGGTALANRKVVAGGGAGNGADGSTVFQGGNGGGPVGANSAVNVFGSAAKGGTQALGGAPAAYPGWASGSFGLSGTGGAGSTQGISGGGGGGYYGGGGGVWTGGGGGSSYNDPITTSTVMHWQGANTGDGMVKLYYNHPGTYSIIWDATAIAAGFANQVILALPESDFTFPVPVGVAAGTYHAELTIDNGNCSSPVYPIQITIKPKPTVNNPGTISVCHGGFIPDINFTGSAPNPSDYKWINSRPEIGLAGSGEGHITTFSPINTTAMPLVANITVIPVVDGCIGDTMTFQIVDNPVPVLNSTLSPASICNNALFSYIPNSLTPGASFDWARDAVAGIDNPAAGGSGNPNETLTNSSNDPIAVTYVYTVTANTCENTQSVVVNVNPTSTLTSSANPPALCNSESFDYTPVPSAPSAVITWSRESVPGISNSAATGSGAISEVLLNTTVAPISVTYVVTMNVDGCLYNENVVVTVNPPLTLSSVTSISPVCDSVVTSYAATCAVPGALLTWTRPAIIGINNPSTSGTGGFTETLVNTTTDYVTATYNYTLAAFGCTNTQNVTVAVKPRPRLNSTLTPAGICTNLYFDYTPSSATTGVTYIWARNVVAGIANSAVLSSGNVHEVLINTTELPITVPYLYTSTANGCLNQETVNVVVNPLPKISNDISSLAVCDSAILTFNPTSNTPGAAFSWRRAYEAGISNLTANGTGNPNERLNNTTYITVPATYVYTITANGCLNTQNVVVDVRPSPVLTTKTAVTCSGAPFTFDPISYTTLATFAWSRDSVGGISPVRASGDGSIEDMLTHTSSGIVTVNYDYALTIYGCVNMQTLTVTVNPAPVPAPITIHPSANLCNSSMYMNFGAEVPAPSGFSYSWSTTNGELYSTGNGGQFAVVNFNTPGTAVVTLTSTNQATTCKGYTSFTVNVSNNPVAIPEVIYFDGQFICKDNQLASYQWGYDDANSLDSNVLAGETNQNYANAFPDFTNRYYWVMTTTAGGCTQKTYYNKPTGVSDFAAIEAGMRLFPNPATSFINVEVSNVMGNNITMDVYNMVGQKIQSVPAVNNKAQISIADLPAGAYIVDCYSDGTKVAAARFIKN